MRRLQLVRQLRIERQCGDRGHAARVPRNGPDTADRNAHDADATGHGPQADADDPGPDVADRAGAAAPGAHGRAVADDAAGRNDATGGEAGRRQWPVRPSDAEPTPPAPTLQKPAEEPANDLFGTEPTPSTEKPAEGGRPNSRRATRCSASRRPLRSRARPRKSRPMDRPIAGD